MIAYGQMGFVMKSQLLLLEPAQHLKVIKQHVNLIDLVAQILVELLPLIHVFLIVLLNLEEQVL
jgi:hypothetical protein